MSEIPTTPAPPKAKKLPFKPTALRRSASKFVAPVNHGKAQDDDGLDLFRRSKEMRPIMEADRERRLKKKQKLEEERRKAAATAGKRLSEDYAENDNAPSLTTPVSPSVIRSMTPVNVYHGGTSEEASELVTPPASKRTRLSSTPKNLSFSSGEPDSVIHIPFLSRIASAVTQGSPSQSSANMLSSTPAPIILSESDDDDNDDHAPTPTPRKNEDEVEALGSSFAATDEDDEFAEYIRKAEEQRRDQALSEASRNSDAAKESIHILVTSLVPNSKPCQVKYLYSRPLRVVRDTWLALQKQKGILTDVDDTDEIVLTWRRKKVYASSTLLNLGIRPEGNGRAVVDGHNTKGLGDNRTQVHMEVWTKELFQEMEREEELQRKREAGELSDDVNSPGLATVESPAREIKLRVILKARGLEDVKLTVRPETTVETLITGFRTKQPTASGKDVGIWFDGDRLEEHMTMDEVEIDDMDTLEVHIK